MNYPNTRLSRLRQHKALRLLVQETALRPQDLILPLFIHHGKKFKQPIASMPLHYQFSVDQLAEEIASICDLNILGVLLFGIPAEKDAQGSDAYTEQGIIQQAIRQIKSLAPDLLVITDVCLCEYTDHGHCGILANPTAQQMHPVTPVQAQAPSQIQNQPIRDNDASLALLARQAVSHAQAGADVIAPSAMVDGMVTHLRQALDSNGYQMIPILSYAVKYASSLYGPFRQAAQGSPQFGDRRSYQMDPANAREALHEAALDVTEGADIIMVKPALPYLDIIYRVRQQFPFMPLAAYQVSGEYAMLKAAAEKGWLDEQKAVLEQLTAIKRAGADFIISYYTKEVIRWLLHC